MEKKYYIIITTLLFIIGILFGYIINNKEDKNKKDTYEIKIDNDYINESKKGEAEQSILGYIDAIEKQVMINELGNDAIQISNGDYSIEELRSAGVNSYGSIPSSIIYPSSGKIHISNGMVSNTIFKIENYTVEYNALTGKATAK